MCNNLDIFDLKTAKQYTVWRSHIGVRILFPVFRVWVFFIKFYSVLFFFHDMEGRRFLRRVFLCQLLRDIDNVIETGNLIYQLLNVIVVFSWTCQWHVWLYNDKVLRNYWIYIGTFNYYKTMSRTIIVTRFYRICQLCKMLYQRWSGFCYSPWFRSCVYSFLINF